ncbi:MAG: carbon-nitrogen hydrolase family protein [Anaerolineae bacterium CG2_30_64_16]|nr:MAG: carbon-nitrogen hydrolase family protein [Anaerolineae bacterium CG2_30_64_16]
MQRFTAACAQFAITPMDVAANVAKSVAWTRRAVDESGAQLIVLPETITTGFVPGMGPAGLWDLVDALPGRLSEPLQEVAQASGVYLVFGAYERGGERGIVYNSAALIGPSGDLLGVYRKTHLFPTERMIEDQTRRVFGNPSGLSGWSTPGADPVVIETPFAAIGLTICYDGDFPELYRAEAIMGAEVIVRPSALLRSFEIWELTNRARAYDNHVYIVAANAVGPDAGGNYYFGHSMIVDPIAHKLAQARGTEEIIYAELDPDPIKRITYGADSPMIFDHLQDRNVAAYRNILTPARSRFEPAQR